MHAVQSIKAKKIKWTSPPKKYIVFHKSYMRIILLYNYMVSIALQLVKERKGLKSYRLVWEMFFFSSLVPGLVSS